jgi:aldehyde dehydrogenase (NAD+)
VTDHHPALAVEPETLLLVDGDLRPATGGATYDDVDPTTGRSAGPAPDATRTDADAALAAARRAFDESGWATDLDLRVRVLRQLDEALRANEELLTTLTIAEVGAPRASCATVQVHEPLETVGYHAHLAEDYPWTQDLGRRDTIGGPADRWVEREPIGVVAAITPWNVPNQINLAKVGPALAAGCTVVLKPAPHTPWTGLALGRIAARETDLPPGVLNVVTSADPRFGEHLTTDPRVDMISFTGSTATGRRIMAVAAERLTKVFLELGGKSVHLVLDDVADLSTMALHAAFGMATVAGQGCALTTRVLLPRARYDEGVEALAAMFDAITVGDPSDPATTMGPLISSDQRDRVEGYVRGALDDGAVLVRGGGRPSDRPDGWFVEPTLLAGVDNSMTVAREEIFGPVLVAIPHDGDDDAVAIANDSPYGLSGAVFGDDEARARAVARRIRTGTIGINGGVWYGPDVPFGGYKESGIGREMGVAGFEEYLEIKAYASPAG